MKPKTRGYNAIHLAQGMAFPHNTEPTKGANPLAYEEFCARLETAGVNMLRIKLCGWNGPLGTSADSFEPRYGQFNDWDGRLTELVAACEAHGVGIHAIPFDRVEFGRGDAWSKHAWNARNGGWMPDASRVFVDARAIDAAKARIDALVEMAGSVICSWEIMAEMHYILQYDVFNTDWPGLRRVALEEGRPWCEMIAQHIKSRHPAPVGNGNVRAIGGNSEFMNEMFRTPSQDFAMMNWYGKTDIRNKMPSLRRAQEFMGKPIYIEQYAPWTIGDSSGYERDESPHPRSKAHEWAAVCGEYGCVGPIRWMEVGSYCGPISSWWGNAHPSLANIAGVTEQFAEAVDLSDWNGRGRSWDDKVQSNDLSFVSAWGDGKHVTAFVDWWQDGNKQVAVSGLSGEECLVRSFNYLTGNEISGQTVSIWNGVATFDVPTVDTYAAFYLSAGGTTPIPDPERWTFHIRMDGHSSLGNDMSFEGTLEQVES